MHVGCKGIDLTKWITEKEASTSVSQLFVDEIEIETVHHSYTIGSLPVCLIQHNKMCRIDETIYDPLMPVSMYFLLH